VKAAIRSLVLAAVGLVASAAPASAAPPRYTANNTVPIRGSTFYDEARYGEFLPHSSPGSAFSSYGVAYPHPYYRNSPPANYPQPTYSRSGKLIGLFNGGFRGSAFNK
jgi:hypothetical protein